MAAIREDKLYSAITGEYIRNLTEEDDSGDIVYCGLGEFVVYIAHSGKMKYFRPQNYPFIDGSHKTRWGRLGLTEGQEWRITKEKLDEIKKEIQELIKTDHYGDLRMGPPFFSRPRYVGKDYMEKYQEDLKEYNRKCTQEV